jgi:hypothetical protein
MGSLELRPMSKKGKTALLVGVLAVVLLGLYRNFGVPFVRFWPLILLNTLLRVPGDYVLRLLRPRWPAIGFEIFNWIFQVGTVLLVWWGLRRIRPFLRGKAQEVNGTAPQMIPPDQGVRIRRIRLALAGGILFALLIVSGRCSHGAVGMLDLFLGVYGYPHHVTTEVKVQAEIGKRPETGKARRPPILFVFGEAGALQHHGSLTKDLWRITSEPRTSMLGFSFSGGESFKEIYEEQKKSGRELLSDPGRSGSSDSPRRGYYRGGNDKSVISDNLDLFLARAGGGWWRELAGGFVVAVKTAIPEGKPINGPRSSLPASVLHAETLDSACDFIGGLMGVDIYNATRTVMGQGSFGPLIEPGEDPGGLHVSMDHEHSLSEILEAVALSQRAAVEKQDRRFVVQDLRDDEVKSRVEQLFEMRRSKTSWSYPDRFLSQFPLGSASYVTAYLDDEDDEIIRYAVSVLEVVGVEPGLADLRRLLATGQTRRGRTLSAGTREAVAEILMKAGEPAALSYLKKAKLLDRERVSFWLDDRVNAPPTLGAVAIQSELLAMFKNRPPMVRPGKLLIRDLPAGLTRADAKAAVRTALDIVNAFCDLYWDDDASATLTFSPNGRTARYSLELSHDWGPLAAGANPYDVELVRVDGRWLVTRAWSGFGWIS